MSHVSAYCPFSLLSIIQVRYLFKIYPGYTGHKRDFFLHLPQKTEPYKMQTIAALASPHTPAAVSPA